MVALKRLRAHRAPGIDGITNEMWQELESLRPALFELCRRSLREGAPIGEIIDAVIVPVLKEGKICTEAASYRPITLFNTILKVLEAVVLGRLEEDVEKAYDRVEYWLVVTTLWKAGVRGYLVQWIASYLQGRRIKVREGGVYSEAKEITEALAQGGLLPPFIFAVVVSPRPFAL